jgi:hypothetical protein
MDWYKTTKSIDYTVYHDVIELIKNVPQLIEQENTIIFMKNTMSGMGSQLTIFSQNSHFVQTKINKNIICIPHYSENNQQFKYHEETCINSFFLYFKLTDPYVNLIESIEKEKWNIYFCQAIFWIPNHPEFDRYSFNAFYSENNRIFYNHFKSKFTLNILSNNYYSSIQDNNKTTRLIGIHLRSKYHAQAEYAQFGIVNIKDVLLKLKNRFEKLYNGNYRVFVATDVSMYIDYCKEIFVDTDTTSNKFLYLPEIERISTDDRDSIPFLENKKGYKLGLDIFSECKKLSECDELWLSTSNITCILEFIGRTTTDDNIHWLYGNI